MCVTIITPFLSQASSYYSAITLGHVTFLLLVEKIIFPFRAPTFGFPNLLESMIMMMMTKM